MNEKKKLLEIRFYNTSLKCCFFLQVMVYNLHLLCHDEERENNEEIETVDSEKIIVSFCC